MLIVMKIRFIYVFFAAWIPFSCYTPEPLPKVIENEYELAFPLIDTALEVMNFPYFSISSALPDNMLLPAGTVIESETQNFPFYIGDWTEKGQSVEWVELNLTLSYYRMNKGAITINIYTQNGTNKEYFWLPQNYEIKTNMANYEVVGNPTKIALTPAQLNAVKDAGRIYFDAGLMFDENINGKDLTTSYIRAKLSMKVKVRMSLKINM
jgi:hypothetical protein